MILRFSKIYFDLFLHILGMDVTIAPERVNEIANKATSKLNSGIVELRRLFLVENMMDSIKFGLSLWVLTYIGR